MNDNVKPIKPGTVIEAKAVNSKIASDLRELADLIEQGQEGDVEQLVVSTSDYTGKVRSYGYGENMRRDRILGLMHMAMHKVTVEDGDN